MWTLFVKKKSDTFDFICKKTTLLTLFVKKATLLTLFVKKSDTFDFICKKSDTFDFICKKNDTFDFICKKATLLTLFVKKATLFQLPQFKLAYLNHYRQYPVEQIANNMLTTHSPSTAYIRRGVFPMRFLRECFTSLPTSASCADDATRAGVPGATRRAWWPTSPTSGSSGSTAWPQVESWQRKF